MRQRALALSLLSVAVVALLHSYFGLGREYYWTLWWWDIVVHICAGVSVGLAVAWALAALEKRPSLAHCVGGALAVGIVWEVFEYGVFGMHTAVFMSYPLDTAKDLLDDSIGGLLAGLLIGRMRL